MPHKVYVISRRAIDEIRKFYSNVARKYATTYSSTLMSQNIANARNAIYEIENGLPRRKPTLTRWRGLYMASYIVEGKTRWNYAYRIENGTVYVEDACHAQNMSEFISSSIISNPKYRKLTKKPLFGYSFVMNDRKEYNLIDSNGKLLTQWFRAIKPINQLQPYGKYQIIAYINVGGFFCALGYDGKVYNMNKTWKEMYSENRNILNAVLFMNIITENIDNTMKNKKVIRLTESDLHIMIEESVKQVLNELDPRTLASASNKAATAKDYRRAERFAAHGRKTWNDKYADKGVSMTGYFPFEYKDKPNNYDDIDFGLHYTEDTPDGRFGKRYHYDDKYDGDGVDKNGDFVNDEDWYFTSKYSNVPIGYQEEWEEPHFDGDAWYYNGPFYFNKDGKDYDNMDDYTSPSEVKKKIRSKISPEGLSVARQMGRGDGKYIKGKGWQ